MERIHSLGQPLKTAHTDGCVGLFVEKVAIKVLFQQTTLSRRVTSDHMKDKYQLHPYVRHGRVTTERVRVRDSQVRTMYVEAIGRYRSSQRSNVYRGSSKAGDGIWDPGSDNCEQSEAQSSHRHSWPCLEA